jgi:hypothetical protein
MEMVQSAGNTFSQEHGLLLLLGLNYPVQCNELFEVRTFGAEKQIA